MPKYAPLTRHLTALGQPRVAMTFAEIEAVLGFALPPSARRHRAFWSNNTTNRVLPEAWRAAGYQSRAVDLEAGKLLFEKLNTVEAGELPDHPIWGCMAGKISVAPGVDLTEPLYTDSEIDAWIDVTARRIAGEVV
jgi:hypothetical protein